MSTDDTRFAGPIPEVYDSFMVPLLFEHYAAEMARRLAGLVPKALLEIAAGSGVVTRAVAPKLDKEAVYTVSDLNPAMLETAKSRQPEPERLQWQVANALDLPFADASFDAAICQFGVMFYPDRVRGHAEAFRVLRPDGTYIFSVWDHIGNNELAEAVTAAAATVFPENPPLFMVRIPHGYYELASIESDLRAAGFSNASHEVITAQSHAPTARQAATAFCKGTPFRHEIESRDAARLEDVVDAAELLIASRHGAGPLSAKMQAIVFTAQK